MNYKIFKEWLIKLKTINNLQENIVLNIHALELILAEPYKKDTENKIIDLLTLLVKAGAKVDKEEVRYPVCYAVDMIREQFRDPKTLQEFIISYPLWHIEMLIENPHNFIEIAKKIYNDAKEKIFQSCPDISKREDFHNELGDEVIKAVREKVSFSTYTIIDFSTYYEKINLLLSDLNPHDVNAGAFFQMALSERAVSLAVENLNKLNPEIDDLNEIINNKTNDVCKRRKTFALIVKKLKTISKERNSFLEKLKESEELENKLTTYRLELTLPISSNAVKQFKKIESDLNKKANEIAILFMNMSEENNSFGLEALKKQHISYGKVKSIFSVNYQILKKPLIIYYKHLIEHTYKKLHTADSTKMKNALQATDKVCTHFNPHKSMEITQYKACIKAVLASLDTKEIGNKTNIEFITAHKDPSALRILKAVIAVISGLAIIGLVTIGVLINDSKKRKGTFNFFSSEGKTVSHARQEVEKNLNIKNF